MTVRQLLVASFDPYGLVQSPGTLSLTGTGVGTLTFSSSGTADINGDPAGRWYPEGLTPPTVYVCSNISSNSAGQPASTSTITSCGLGYSSSADSPTLVCDPYDPGGGAVLEGTVSVYADSGKTRVLTSFSFAMSMSE